MIWGLRQVSHNSHKLRVITNSKTLIHSEHFEIIAVTPCQRIGEMPLKYEHYAVKNAKELHI